MQNFKFKSFLEKIYSDKQNFNKKCILKYESNINCKIDNIFDEKDILLYIAKKSVIVFGYSIN